MSDTESFFITSWPSTDDYQLDGETLTFPSAYVSPHPQNNVVRARYFPARLRHGAPRARTRRARAPALERAGRCAYRALPGLGSRGHQRASAQPALPRPAYAPRAPSRRLRRQLQRGPDGAGLPPGGARFAPRHRLVGSGRLRSDRDSRHESRVVPRAVDDGARAADTSRRAQSHLAVLRRRRVGRSVDRSRARRSGRITIELDRLRAMWLPISPLPYLARLDSGHARRSCGLVYARYDLSFPVTLSRMLVDECRHDWLDNSRVPRSLRPAVRSLQHRHRPVQLDRCRLRADSISSAAALAARQASSESTLVLRRDICTAPRRGTSTTRLLVLPHWNAQGCAYRALPGLSRGHQRVRSALYHDQRMPPGRARLRRQIVGRRGLPPGGVDSRRDRLVGSGRLRSGRDSRPSLGSASRC